MPQQYDRRFLLVRDVPQVTVFVRGHRNLVIDSIRRSRPYLEREIAIVVIKARYAASEPKI